MRKLRVLIAFLYLLFGFETFAALAGASTIGLAGSGRSSVNPTESFLLNPATLAHFNGASLTLSSYFFEVPAQKKEPLRSKAWRLSIAENSPMNELPLALSFAHKNGIDSTQSDFWFSAGDFVSPYLAAGFAYHYADQRVPSSRYLRFANNGILSIMFTPNPIMGLSLVFEDFLPDKSELTAPQVGISAVFLYDSFFRIHTDLVSSQSPQYNQHITASLGLENMINEWVLTRWGTSQTHLIPKDSDKALTEHAFAFGLGFLGPKFEIYLSSKQNTGIQYSKEHSVDFHIPF